MSMKRLIFITDAGLVCKVSLLKFAGLRLMLWSSITGCDVN